MKHLPTNPLAFHTRAIAFDPAARTYDAYHLNGARLLARLGAETLDSACAEATERWVWDRGDQLGIREIGLEDAPCYPFEKRPLDRLRIYAVRRSAPICWKLSRDGFRTEPVYRYSLKLIVTIDLRMFRDEGCDRTNAIRAIPRDAGAANNRPASDK